jgi:REP element-mobilizing transposase RayT
MKELPVRKPNRLKGYDYSSQGAYFVTICTAKHAEIFAAVGANCVRPLLTKVGTIVEAEITAISNTYSNVSVDKHIVMPNHVHMIIIIGRTQFAPTLSRIIKQWKGSISKAIGFSPWQKSFHDHIIRSENEYNKIANYIENNPNTWKDDCFFSHK